MKAVVAESADNLGKYGLNVPPITFTVTEDNGKSATLLVGKKEGKRLLREGLFASHDFQGE